MWWRLHRSASRGQAFPLVAFSMTVVIGLASMAIDVGYWRYQQRLEQTAADSAALAGAVQLGYTSTTSSITAAAQTDAATNGFTNDGVATTVTVNQPPLSGSYAGNASAVEVIVSRKLPVHFTALFGQSSTTVSARAVAMLSNVNRNCIYALSTSSSAITMDGPTINIPKCGIISNGGYLINQGSVTAASVAYAAGASNTFNNVTWGSATPAPSIPATDPCGSVPGCSYLKQNPPTSGPCMSQTTFNSSSTMTLQPGKYCNQVIIEGSGAVVFSPGVYDFEGGFTVNSGPPSVTGSGVTFYNNGGSIIIDTSPTNLTPPTTGNYAGVLVFQPSTNSSQFHINTTAGQGWQGMLYFPSANMMIDGALSSWLLVVANSITLNSDSGVNDSDSAFPVGGHAVLVE